MGTQGEIYNVLGVVLPAKEIQQDLLYEVAGKTVGTSEYSGAADFEEGLMRNPLASNGIQHPDAIPEFSIRVLGYDDKTKGFHFEGDALVGYPIVNQSYVARVTQLPPFAAIENLKPRLVEDIRSKLGVEVERSRLELYLLMDFMQ
jgi:hypothetical protein